MVVLAQSLVVPYWKLLLHVELRYQRVVDVVVVVPVELRTCSKVALRVLRVLGEVRMFAFPREDVMCIRVVLVL